MIPRSRYIAPEVYRNEEYSPKADLWSTGVVLLEMFLDKILNVDRDKAALAMIPEIVAELPEVRAIRGITHPHLVLT